MKTLIFENDTMHYDKKNKTFQVSEVHAGGFATVYRVLNPKTGEHKDFELSHSTGPEFDPKTRWVYKSGDLTLEVCNDEYVTEIQARNYLKAKLRH